jgi:hypothetical protein
MFSNGLGINSNDARNRMHPCIRLLYRIGSRYSEAIRMKINYPKVAEHLGVPLRGNETFTELLEIEKQVKEHKERLAEMNANIQRVDAQVKGVKKW